MQNVLDFFSNTPYTRNEMNELDTIAEMKGSDKFDHRDDIDKFVGDNGGNEVVLD